MFLHIAKRIVLLGCIAQLGLSGGGLGLAQAAESLSLDRDLERVLAYHEQVQVPLFKTEVSRLAIESAKGVFEPEVVLRAQYDETLRPNNAEELRNLGGAPFFQQRQWLYSAALEMLAPSGARTRLDLDVRNINDNLQPFRQVDQEWSTFLGFSVVQPLLKGAGTDATMAAGVRLVDTRQVRFVANVPATEAGSLSVGASVVLQVGTVALEGVVTFVSPIIDLSSGLVTVNARFDNAEGRVRPGAAGSMRRKR